MIFLASAPVAPDLTPLFTALLARWPLYVSAGVGMVVIPWGLDYFKGILEQFVDDHKPHNPFAARNYVRDQLDSLRSRRERLDEKIDFLEDILGGGDSDGTDPLGDLDDDD